MGGVLVVAALAVTWLPGGPAHAPTPSGDPVTADDASIGARGEGDAPDINAPMIADASTSRRAPRQPAPSVGSDATASVDASGRRARAAASEHGESNVSQRWDELSADARRDHDRAALESALARFESRAASTGGADPALVRQGETALSALRVTLYGTPGGRAEHAAYERRLEAATQTSASPSEASR